MKIYLSPSDQNRNIYAYGNTTEQIQCCRIADECEKALRRCGFDVINNQSYTMEDRVAESNAWGADLHIPIHTNAYDGEVSGTRMFYYSAGGFGRRACEAIFRYLAPITPGTSENIKMAPDLYELNSTLMTAAYIEVDFHDVPDTAKWIIDHVADIGEAIAQGVCDYFAVPYVKKDADTKSEALPEPEWSKREGFWKKATASGTVDGTRPQANITRAEVIAILGRLGLIK